MTSTSDPAPLFDLVTGFPPDDAIDVTVPMPLSLAIYMTMLESTGHAAELATLRRVHVEQARETARRVETGVAALVGPDLPAPARPRITHLVDERVRPVPGLRLHLHVFVGATARCPDGTDRRVDADRLAAWADTDLLPDHRDRLAAVTADRCGLVWGPTAWSARELVEPPWLQERAAALRDGEPTCPGPWPRRQIVVGRHHADRDRIA